MTPANQLYLPEWKGDDSEIWTALLDPCEDHFLNRKEAVAVIAGIKFSATSERPGTYRVSPTSTGRYIQSAKTQESCVEA